MVKLTPDRYKECHTIDFLCERNGCPFQSISYSLHTSHMIWDDEKGNIGIPFHIDNCPVCGGPLTPEWDD